MRPIFSALALLTLGAAPALAEQSWNDDCAAPNKAALAASGCAALDDFMRTT